jgi:hypothetical protein
MHFSTRHKVSSNRSNDETGWLGRPQRGRSRSVADRSHASGPPSSSEHKGESHATSASAGMHLQVRSEAGAGASRCEGRDQTKNPGRRRIPV